MPMGGDMYLAIQEEDTRGEEIHDDPSFIPIESQGLKPVFVEEEDNEFRGDGVSIREQKTIQRYGESVAGPFAGKFYPEGGGNKAGIALLLKYLFGDAHTTQINSSSTHVHGFKKARDPFDADCGTIGDKGISVHVNRPTVCDTLEDYPNVGCRVAGITLTQEPAGPLRYSVDLFGQKQNDRTTKLAGATYSSVGFFKQQHCKIYDGVTPAGVAPDYTSFAKGAANSVLVRTLNIGMVNGNTDAVVLGSEVDYPTETDIGKIISTISITAQARDATTGFSALDMYDDWRADNRIELYFEWDNLEVIAGTDTYKLMIHCPVVKITDSNIDDVINGMNMISMTGNCLYSDTDKYAIGVFLQNSASSV